MPVVPIRKQEDPEAAYLMAYQIEGGQMNVFCENLEPIHILILRKFIEELENEFVGDAKAP